MTQKKAIARKIISNGFFAVQIPKEFNSSILSETLELLDLSKSKLSKKGLSKWCKLIEFSVPKGENFRRNLSIPHPLHYILLAQLFEEKWDDLEVHFLKSKFSLTTPQISEDSITTINTIPDRIDRRIHNLVSKRYILQADIARYYPSIYTHTIPWSLHTKKLAKDNMNDDRYYGNTIDRLIRNMQDGQTVGIPIGPMTSTIVQEIVGTSIDIDFDGRYGDGLVGYRYTDDMEFYFSTLEEAERALSILNKTLKYYGLDLNYSKTKILKVPQVLEPEWIYFFKKYEFRTNTRNKEDSIEQQKVDIKEFFSVVFKYKNQLNEKGIMKYAVKVFRSVIIFRENWSLVESLLLQCILVDATVIPTVFETIEGYKYREYPLNTEKIENFINVLIKDNIEVRNDFEVSWALSFAKNLNISIDAEASRLLLKCDNAIINLLVLILDSEKLLKGTLDFSYYESLLVEDSLYDDNWIFYYECCMKGWLDKDKSNHHFMNDKFFKQLIDNSISFLDPSYSNALEEVKNSVISLCIKHFRDDRETYEINEIVESVLVQYSFSLEKSTIEELNNRLELEISKIRSYEESEDELIEDEKTDDEKTYDEEIEDVEERQEDEVISKAGWLFNFFTTDIDKSTKVKSFEIDDEY